MFQGRMHGHGVGVIIDHSRSMAASEGKKFDGDELTTARTEQNGISGVYLRKRWHGPPRVMDWRNMIIA